MPCASVLRQIFVKVTVLLLHPTTRMIRMDTVIRTDTIRIDSMISIRANTIPMIIINVIDMVHTKVINATDTIVEATLILTVLGTKIHTTDQSIQLLMLFGKFAKARFEFSEYCFDDNLMIKESLVLRF